MIQVIAERLRALKAECPKVASIRSVSLDTANDYIVEYKDRPAIVYPKTEVEADVEKFILFLATDAN